MSINIEKEERAMLSKSIYKTLIKDLVKKEKPIFLTNYYFDTKDLKYLNNHIVIRIRKIDENAFELTIKIKGKDGDKEINKSLSKNEAISYLKTKQIIDLNIDGNIDSIYYIVDLSTKRYEISFNDYLLVIDENHYYDTIDYNIEIESKLSKEHAKTIIFEYAKKYGFNYDPNYISKSRRAINTYLIKN